MWVIGPGRANGRHGRLDTKTLQSLGLRLNASLDASCPINPSLIPTTLTDENHSKARRLGSREASVVGKYSTWPFPNLALSHAGTIVKLHLGEHQMQTAFETTIAHDNGEEKIQERHDGLALPMFPKGEACFIVSLNYCILQILTVSQSGVIKGPRSKPIVHDDNPLKTSTLSLKRTKSAFLAFHSSPFRRNGRGYFAKILGVDPLILIEYDEMYVRKLGILALLDRMEEIMHIHDESYLRYVRLSALAFLTPHQANYFLSVGMLWPATVFRGNWSLFISMVRCAEPLESFSRARVSYSTKFVIIAGSGTIIAVYIEISPRLHPDVYLLAPWFSKTHVDIVAGVVLFVVLTYQSVNHRVFVSIMVIVAGLYAIALLPIKANFWDVKTKRAYLQHDQLVSIQLSKLFVFAGLVQPWELLS
ncbi:uncharacterized protein BDR25DRAFT_356879 [Lindgomyces ingoldianus]|uniref:Uncharacterized protein n=1 Tax=Lindgomyces ingoldianus TaxID=673940 RepID=A0ACB6QQ07_9PLEO|nr:uncharacterized protein BDR25DRAFT_356879 [Lindgomyces ingoldianus]KAF2469094.1 hypothetical protein BDR25DRAFT_356879 [Lindgomyces ingoldianus]